MKNALTGAAIFLAVTAAMLLVAEWSVRILYADNTVLFPRYHTEAVYGDYTIRRIRPDSRFKHTSIDGSWEFVTNSQGFRNSDDFDYEKPAGVMRVLSLGDSHTQGYETRQEHTFSAVTERYLNKSGVDAQVINTGVSGFSTAEALVLLENEGLKYQPDAVVLGFFANDLEDNLKASLFEIGTDGELVATRYTHIPGVRAQNFIYSVPGITWLSENSYFYSMLFNSVWEFFKSRLRQQSEERVAEFAVPQKEEFSSYEIDLAAALLKRMHKVCADNDIPFIIVDIPLQVVDSKVMSSFPAELRPMASRYSDAFIDSTELFEQYAGAAELHVPHGHRHISEFSHALIGAAVGRQILNLSKRVDASAPAQSSGR